MHVQLVCFELSNHLIISLPISAECNQLASEVTRMRTATDEPMSGVKVVYSGQRGHRGVVALNFIECQRGQSIAEDMVLYACSDSMNEDAIASPVCSLAS